MTAHSIYDVPCEAVAGTRSVLVHGPSDVDYQMTVGAALESASRMTNAAIDVLMSGPIPPMMPHPV